MVTGIATIVASLDTFHVTVPVNRSLVVVVAVVVVAVTAGQSSVTTAVERVTCPVNAQRPVVSVVVCH